MHEDEEYLNISDYAELDEITDMGEVQYIIEEAIFYKGDTAYVLAQTYRYGIRPISVYGWNAYNIKLDLMIQFNPPVNKLPI